MNDAKDVYTRGIRPRLLEQTRAGHAASRTRLSTAHSIRTVAAPAGDKSPLTIRIGLLGSRGVPARYGGFETAFEEVGKRLARSGHEVVVYCRTGNSGEGSDPTSHLGMELVHLPAVRRKVAETLSHTFLSALHLLATRERPDAVVLCNAANAPAVPLLHLAGIPVALHVDGLEWQRPKWGTVGKAYYRLAEALSVRWADALIADAHGIQQYFTEEFGAETTYIPYGVPDLAAGTDRLAELGLATGGFHLIVARIEPENSVVPAVEGYLASGAHLPLVIVGANPYGGAYSTRLDELADQSDLVHRLGSVWDQDLLAQLYSGALTYIHGHTVGGTNPSLLRAMGAETYVLARDVVFNREVTGDLAGYWDGVPDLAEKIRYAETHPAATDSRGKQLGELARENYDWDRVAHDYLGLARRLADGHTQRRWYTGRRAAASTWDAVTSRISRGHLVGERGVMPMVLPKKLLAVARKPVPSQGQASSPAQKPVTPDEARVVATSTTAASPPPGEARLAAQSTPVTDLLPAKQPTPALTSPDQPASAEAQGPLSGLTGVSRSAQATTARQDTFVGRRRLAAARSWSWSWRTMWPTVIIPAVTTLIVLVIAPQLINPGYAASAQVPIATVSGQYATYEASTFAADFMVAFDSSQSRDAAATATGRDTETGQLTSSHVGETTYVSVVYDADTSDLAQAGLRAAMTSSMSQLATSIRTRSDIALRSAQGRRTAALRSVSQPGDPPDGVSASAWVASQQNLLTSAEADLVDAQASAAEAAASAAAVDALVADIPVITRPLSTASAVVRAVLAATVSALLLGIAISVMLIRREADDSGDPMEPSQEPAEHSPV
ncbi:MAG: DUF1972 domain-containing protein [Nostocoides sp.]